MPAAEEVDYVDHPLLEPQFIERRLYQLQLAGTARNHHTLVCLPTGLGKTTVSLLVTADRLDEVGGKSLFLAPTKPLVEQHAAFYREALQIPDEEIVVFTGEVSPDDRAELWDSARIVIATPQVVENDLVGSRVSLRDVTHLTFDECHRASGDYAYNYIAERYHADASDPLVTGMSASPGGDEEAILEVCENLGLSEVEVMTEEDADVSRFTHETEVTWERVELPDDLLSIRDGINEVITERLEALKKLGVTNTTNPDMSQKDLNKMRGQLQGLIDAGKSEGYQGMSVHAEIMKLRRAVTLVETQSVEALRRYFERQRNAARSSGASKASQRLVSEPTVRDAMRKAENFEGIHPKASKLRILVAETLGIQGGERVIVFTESRDTAEVLVDFLSDHFSVEKFVGQGNRSGNDGMTQKQQQETLDAFRAGEFEVLVSTSVAEEGLDVPEVDLVVFYEPVPTAIRSIQRKGRTGRQTEGRVIVLLANDTRDEAYFWISKRREKEMESELRELKGVAEEVEAELDVDQQQLDQFGEGQSDLTAFERTNGGADSAPAGAESAGGGNGDTTDSESDGKGGANDESDGADGGSSSSDDEPEGVVATARGSDDEVEIVADQREMDANIARDLSMRDGVRVRLETLQVGDYVLSDRVVVERKTVADFLDTLTGGERSLFEQIGDATRHYARPVLVLEGDGLYEERNVHPNAIRGALASLAVDYGASVLRTNDESDTTDLLEVIATREQEEGDREVSVHGEKGAKTMAEQQEYVVGAIADIGPVTARSLLDELGSVEAVMTASEEDLLSVHGVGEVTAERIREVVANEYDP